MRTSLVTREEMIEAIEQAHCLYQYQGYTGRYCQLLHDHQTTLPEKGQTRGSPHSANRYP